MATVTTTGGESEAVCTHLATDPSAQGRGGEQVVEAALFPPHLPHLSSTSPSSLPPLAFSLLLPLLLQSTISYMDAEHEVVAEVLATDNRGERERVACSYSCEWYTSVLLFSLVLRSLEILYSTLRTNKVTTCRPSVSLVRTGS